MRCDVEHFLMSQPTREAMALLPYGLMLINKTAALLEQQETDKRFKEEPDTITERLRVGAR